MKQLPSLNAIRRALGPTVVTALLLTAGMLAVVGFVGRTPEYAPARQHLGAEYFNIARSLADGRGYSDPFGEPTGPTAWMPPLYPSLIAAVLSVFETRRTTADVIALLGGLCLVAVGTGIDAVARSSAWRVRPSAAVLLFVVWLLAFSSWLLILTTDIAFLALIAGLAALVSLKHLGDAPPARLQTGALLGTTWLASPALGFAFSGVLALLALRGRRNLRSWLATVAVAACLVLPWLGRNWLVFGALIPVKSNAGYEMYQANVTDDDGIYDVSSTTRHPFNAAATRFRYAKAGELGFVAAHGQVAARKIRSHPAEFLRRIKNRVVALFVYPPFSPLEEGWRLLARRLVYVVPTLLWIAGFALRGPHRRSLAVLGLFALFYLAPYVLVAFHVRYLLVLTPLIVLAGFLGLDQLFVALKGGEPSSEARTSQHSASQ